jgi:hypothetical protein
LYVDPLLHPTKLRTYLFGFRVFWNTVGLLR